MRRVLVTGGCGFIGSNFIRVLLQEEPEAEVINLDLLTYAGNPKNLADLEDSSRYRFVRGDVRDEALAEELVGEVDWIVNFAAETHVDRSTPAKAGEFIQTNVYGPYALADALRRTQRDARFLQVGTDEVYGSVSAPTRAREDAPLEPSSPYSASKAGGDLVALGFHRMLGMDVLVSRSTNNYGPYQYPEKLIPLAIQKALAREPIPIYGTGGNVRDWIYVEDHVLGLLAAWEHGEVGESYNIGARSQTTNLDLISEVCSILDELAPSEAVGEYSSLITFVEDRPGHDWRYAIDPTKAEGALDWSPNESLSSGLRKTVQWYLENREWCRGVTEKVYAGQRLGLKTERP